MGIRNALQRSFGEARTLDGDTAATLMAGSRDTQSERLSIDRAVTLSDVYSCIRALAEGAAILPLHTYRRDANGGRIRAGSRIADLLHRPAPGVTQSGLVGTVVSHLAAHGNAYIAKYRDTDSKVAQLAPIDPRHVAVKVENGTVAYEVSARDGVKRLGVDDIVHVRMPTSLDGVTGVGPITATRHALAHADALAVSTHEFARNGARPSAVLRFPGRLKDDQREKFRAEVERLYSRPPQAGRIMLIDSGIEWQPVSLSAADAEWVAQRQLSTAEVCRIFRIPPWVIGAPNGDSMTYANVSEQAAAFVKFSLTPILSVIEQAITADRDLCPGGLYVEFIVDGLLRADSETRSRVYAAALDPVTGWMTRAEVRALENLPAEHEVTE